MKDFFFEDQKIFYKCNVTKTHCRTDAHFDTN